MQLSRRSFIQQTSLAGLSFCWPKAGMASGKKVGIIGLDTSHSIEFTKLLNGAAAPAAFNGYKVTAAYPYGSVAIAQGADKIAANTKEIQQYGVSIAGSIEALTGTVDALLLETNDGRMHAAQFDKLLQVGKPVFIDKPVAASLKDVIAMYNKAAQNNVPLLSSSALRYGQTVQQAAAGKFGKVLGAGIYSPAPVEPSHPDLFWYGIHGVEMLFSVMGQGCKTVSRVHTADTDVVIGVWQDDRVGIYRGTRSGRFEYGGSVFCEDGTHSLESFTGYGLLMENITGFFATGKAPVSSKETIEIYAFMEAADESKRLGGATITLESVMQKAYQQN